MRLIVEKPCSQSGQRYRNAHSRVSQVDAVALVTASFNGCTLPNVALRAPRRNRLSHAKLVSPSNMHKSNDHESEGDPYSNRQQNKMYTIIE